MNKSGRYGKYGEKKRQERLKQVKPWDAGSWVKMEERFKISPKHPGGGRH
ncbi:MAG: hypothetical protein JW760_06130 [Spirochaetales bacterium]|nr:hypothetical protein [Spirochaetales bacterium]